MAYKLPNEALEDNTIKVGKLDTAVTNAFVPVGGIIMWNGSIAEAEALSNWKICDGSNGTPDLRDKFVLGVGSSSNASTAAKGEQAGANTIQLSEAQMPSHNHDITDPGHGHGITDNGHFHHEFRSGNAGANQNQGSSNATATNFPGSGTGPSGKYEGYNIWCVGNEPNVGRSSSETTGVSVNNNSAGITSQAKGSGSNIDNRPAYFALCYIMRVS